MLIIQHIYFKWDKSFRGNSGASYLNSLRQPKVFLHQREVAEFKINGRYVGGQTDYEQHFYTQNILYLANIDSERNDLFTKAKIDKTVDFNKVLF